MSALPQHSPPLLRRSPPPPSVPIVACAPPRSMSGLPRSPPAGVSSRPATAAIAWSGDRADDQGCCDGADFPFRFPHVLQRVGKGNGEVQHSLSPHSLV